MEIEEKKQDKSRTVKASKFKESEWETPAPGTRWPMEARRRDLIELAEEVGLYNVDKTKLAKKYGIARSLLYQDIAAIVKGGVTKEDLAHARINLKTGLVKSLREMHSIIHTSKLNSDKVKAVGAYIQAANGYIDFLERFGVKDVKTAPTGGSIHLVWGKKKEEKKEEKK